MSKSITFKYLLQGNRLRFRASILLPFTIGVLLNGCSIKQIAVNHIGEALAEGGDVYAKDNDIDLVGAALPFSLKTIEALLAQSPKHRGLLLTAARGFTQYSYVYVDLAAKQSHNPSDTANLRLRAKRLYLRARDYGIRALELREDNFVARLATTPQLVLSSYTEDQVPELFWTALAWSAAITSDTSDMELLSQLHLIEPMINRCLELDDDYDQGAIYEFLIAFDGGRAAMQGGSLERAQQHFDRAMQLSGNRKVGPLVSLAEHVAVAEQDREQFELLLTQALRFDVNTAPEYRLANLVAQRRASLLLSQSNSLFLED